MVKATLQYNFTHTEPPFVKEFASKEEAEEFALMKMLDIVKIEPLNMNVRAIACKYKNDALEILKNEAISFDEVKDFYPKNQPDKYRNYGPLFVYFMRSGYDVAYFVPSLELLMIHDMPRAWSQNFINNLYSE